MDNIDGPESMKEAVMATIPVEILLKDKKIYQIINPKLVQTSPNMSLKDVIQVMQSNRSGYAVIANQKKPVGIFTEVDVTRKILGKNVDWSAPISDFMTKNPVCLSPNDSVGKAIDVMGEHRFYHLPLVDEQGELVNVISVRTLIRFLAEFYPTEVYNLPPVPNQVMKTREGG